MYKDTEKRKAYLEKYFAENKEKYNKYNRDRYAKTRDWLNKDKLSKGCSICGYNKYAQALHYDHIDRTKKYMSVAYLKSSASIEIIKKEVDKCQVLCANCHAVKTFKNNEYNNVRNKFNKNEK